MRRQVAPGWARNAPSASRLLGAMTSAIRQGRGPSWAIYLAGRAAGRRVCRVNWVGKINFWKPDCAGVDASSPAGVHGDLTQRCRKQRLPQCNLAEYAQAKSP